MAESSATGRELSAQCSSTSASSYWMDVSVDFSDGQGVTNFRVDLPTFRKVMEKDPATLALLKQHREIQLIADSEESQISKPSSDSTALSTVNTGGTPAKGKEPNRKEKETQDRKIPKVWGQQETKLLIDLRVERDSAFRSGRKGHKTLWLEIAKVLGEHGYDFSAEHCSNKWKSLKRAYKDVIDHNSKTGNKPKTCAFFETFDLIYGNSPSTRPQFTLDSTTSAEAEMEDTAEEDVEDEEMRPNNPEKRRLAGRKCRKKKGTSATIEWLNSWKDEEETRKKEREVAIERRHEEKMRRFDRLLDILEKMPDK